MKLHVSYNHVYKGSFPRAYLRFCRASVWQNHVFSFSSSFQVEIKEEVVFLVLVHKKLEKKKRNINPRWISVLNSRRERGVLVLELSYDICLFHFITLRRSHKVPYNLTGFTFCNRQLSTYDSLWKWTSSREVADQSDVDPLKWRDWTRSWKWHV